MNARFWKRWFVLGSLVVSVLVGLMIFALVRRHLWGLPYNDSFASANADEWHAFGGTWELSDAAIRNDSDERGAKLLAGSTN